MPKRTDLHKILMIGSGPIIISQFLVWAAGMIIGIVVSVAVGILSIIPICGWILAFALGLLMLPVGVWLTVFSGHLYGQIGRHAALSVI